jgi:hypothetical protein
LTPNPINVISGTIIFIGGVFFLLFFGSDWFHKREENASLVATVVAQGKTITSNEETIKSQKQTIETWKEHYERLRWQQRTTPPSQPRKGVK